MRAGSPPPYVGPPPVPKMPAGLVDLVEGLTREVLKNNPKDVNEFCAKHLEKLLESRDGPLFKKPMLTLEQKIKEAQEKVRQRAKERRERYDREMMMHNTEQSLTELQQITENDTSKSAESDVSVIKAMPPVHHEESLKPDSEVEIAHKSSYITNEENTNKIEKVETKKEEVKMLPEALALTVNDSNIALSQEKDISKEVPVNAETTLPIKADNDKVEEIINASDTNVDNLSAMDNVAINPTELQSEDIAPDIKEDFAIVTDLTDVKNITDDTKSAAITLSLKEENVAKNNNNNIEDANNDSLSSTEVASDIKDDRNSSMPLNQKVSTKKSAEPQRETNLLAATEPPTFKDDTESDKDEIPLTENKSNHINQSKNSENNKKEENNVRDIEANLQNTNDLKSLPENCDELLNTPVIEQKITTEDLTVSNETVSIAENTSKWNTSSEVINGTDSNAKKDSANTETDVTPNGNDAVVVAEPVDTHKIITTLDKEIDNVIDKTAKVEEVISKSTENNGTETTSSKTTSLNANVAEHTKENIKEATNNDTFTQEKEHANNENPSAKVSENLEMVNNDTDSLVESDLSKIEEDAVGENQNEQNNMDLETAAVTIQKVFRSFLFKSRNSTYDDGTIDEGTSLDYDNDNIKKEEYYATVNLNKERRTLGISRMDTVLQTVNEEKSLSLSTDDSSTLSSAATTIQAHVRGFLVRNRLNSNKTVSTNSVNSNEFLEPDVEQQKNKTVLNIHIVPEEGNYLSRDESIITSMELSLDASPPSSVNLHPATALSYDVSERRKLLKREDAVQSISPPSNNSGKLSEESVKELFINDETVEGNVTIETDRTEETLAPNNDSGVDSEAVSISSTATATTIINITDFTKSPEHKRSKSLQNMDHDEFDVVTPYVPSPRSVSGDYESSSKLVHSGEFHDALLPTRVIRNDTTVVRGE